MRYVVGQPIRAETILKLVPQSGQQIVYVSGAEPMVERVGSDLSERGVTAKQDWFPGYDDKTY